MEPLGYDDWSTALANLRELAQLDLIQILLYTRTATGYYTNYTNYIALTNLTMASRSR